MVRFKISEKNVVHTHSAQIQHNFFVWFLFFSKSSQNAEKDLKTNGFQV